MTDEKETTDLTEEKSYEELVLELEETKRLFAIEKEKQKGYAVLEELIVSRSDPTFGEAVRMAESEAMQSFPAEERYRKSLLMCYGEKYLSERQQQKGRLQMPPAFARSTGVGQAEVMKKPTDFRTARENSFRYLKK